MQLYFNSLCNIASFHNFCKPFYFLACISFIFIFLNKQARIPLQWKFHMITHIICNKLDKACNYTSRQCGFTHHSLATVYSALPHHKIYIQVSKVQSVVTWSQLHYLYQLSKQATMEEWHYWFYDFHEAWSWRCLLKKIFNQILYKQL